MEKQRLSCLTHILKAEPNRIRGLIAGLNYSLFKKGFWSSPGERPWPYHLKKVLSKGGVLLIFAWPQYPRYIDKGVFWFKRQVKVWKSL